MRTSMTLALIALMLVLGPLTAAPVAAQGAAPAQVVVPSDRTVLPIPEPQYPHSTMLDVRNSTPPPRFEVKAPANAPNVLIVLIDDMGFGQMAILVRPDKKAAYMIYPGLKAYCELPPSARTRSSGKDSKTETTDYTVNAATGAITEVVEFGAGRAVVLSYTTDFVMPSTYPVPINGSPNPTISLIASSACSDPMIPGSTPRTPPSAHEGTRSGGGGSA